MVELTPVGKIAIVIAVGLAFYFFLFPLLEGILFPQEKVERSTEIKVIAFLKTFDFDSARLQGTLRELEADKNMQGKVRVDIINIDAEPGKMKQHNVTEKEVPCFILGNRKYEGWHALDWFKNRVTILASLANKKGNEKKDPSGKKQ